MFLARRQGGGNRGSASALAACALSVLLAPGAARADHCGTRGVAGDVVEAPELAEVSVGAAGWRPLRVGAHLCVDDLMRLGLGQRGVVRLQGGAFVTVAENTTLRIERAAAGEGFLLRLAAGLISVFSRRPEALEVGTPFANAAVEGTEFVVAVEADRARVTVLEGRVGFGNPRGRLSLAAGSTAVARAGEAPVLELDVRPRDAVRWALYYPPVSPDLLGDRDEATLAAPLRDALRLRREDRPGAAVARLEATPGASRDATWHVLRAELALAAGRPDEAAAAVNRALALDPGSGEALALRAVAAVARGENAAALADARRAVAVRPGTAAPRLALSYAQQAAFDLDGARATLAEAARVAPDDALVRVRLAEVELARGDLRAAKRAAVEARRLAPDLARTGLAEGFVALAGLDTDAAKAAFAGVIAAEPLNPQARLGQGLARVREGDLAGGREDLELAVALDPGNSLLRSYLGRAYLEERRDKLAGDELATAKGLDPNDPTPWFYDAIRKQQANRPVEALVELERSIALNGNRSPFRSRLALDQDLAGRGVGLGRIYDDLGFRRLGLNEAARSVALDPGGAAAHRFLADLYRGEPRFETVRLSEQLQAQLLQPVGRNPVQPSLAFSDLGTLQSSGPARPAFGEFSPLFQRDGLGLDLTGLAGSDRTRSDEVALTGLLGRTAFSAGQFYFTSDGTRPNNDLRHGIYNAFAQVAVNDDLDVQVDFRSRDTEKGDRTLHFFDDFDPHLDQSRNDNIVRLGAKFRPSPEETILLSISSADHDAENETDDGAASGIELNTSQKRNGEQTEGQYIRNGHVLTLIVGGGAYDTKQHLRIETFLPEIFGPEGLEEEIDLDQEGAFGYAYANLNVTPNLLATVGLGIESHDQPSRSDTRLLPKLGLLWSVSPWLRIRAAAFDALKRGYAVDQTLEPLQFGGFSQLTDEYGGSRIRGAGVAVDLRPARSTALGAEWSHREISPPFVDYFADSGDRTVYLRDHQEQTLRAYLYVAPTSRVALSGAVELTEFRQNAKESQFEPVELDELRVPITARYFHPAGYFGELGGTYIRQEIKRMAVASEQDYDNESDGFFSVDAVVGYRLLSNRMVVSVEGRNLLDNNVRYEDASFRTPEIANLDEQPDPSLFDSRTFLARMTVRF